MRLARLMSVLSLLALAAPPCRPAPPRPRLVVVVVVDQFSAELAARRARDLPGGLGRLWREGAVFTRAYQDHGYTETGPGHSVILTGRHPSHTGIAENTWRNRAQGGNTYCVRDEASPLVEGRGAGVGPALLTGTTLGEWMQGSLEGSRSFAVAGKDRAAVLMAGRRAQGVYWFAPGTGFTTSRAYAQGIPPWLGTWNAAFRSRMAQGPLAWEPSPGSPARPPETWTVAGRTATFGLPRTLRAADGPMDTPFWDRFRASPFYDEAILGAATALLAGERLGQGPGTDLLAISLSATDYIGHQFGTTGPEMEDQLLRLDANLGAFLDRVEAASPGAWMALTADHGARDFPERLAARGVPAQRLQADTWLAAFNRELQGRLGGDRPWFLPRFGHQLYLDPAALAKGGRSRDSVLREAVKLAKETPEVAEAFTSDELFNEKPDPAQAPQDRSLRTRVALSFVPARSGDLLLVFRPQYMVHDPTTFTEHGTPHDHDRRVALVFRGPWRPSVRTEPVRVVDLAPTLAHELGVAPLEPVDGRVIELPGRAPDVLIR